MLYNKSPTIFPSATTDWSYGGLRVRSAVPLPDLPRWRGEEDRAPDVRISFGPVPERLPDPVVARPLLQVGEDGTCRFAIAGVAAWLVSADGRCVTMDPVGDPGRAEISTFLLGTVIAIVLMRQGLLPLHACCLERGGRAFAICGAAGTGKSTLAAMLIARGFRLLADDVTVVDTEANGGPLALPTFARVKLWRDASDRLSLSTDGLAPVRPGLDKFNHPVTAFYPDPLPLKTLLFLEQNGVGPVNPLLRRMAPMDALRLTGVAIYRQQMMVRLGLGSRQMRQFMSVLAGAGGARVLRRPASEADLDALIGFLDAYPDTAA